MMARFASTALAISATLIAVTLSGCTTSLPPASTDVDFTSVAHAGEPAHVQIEVGGIISITPPTPAYVEAKYWNAAIDDPTILTFSPANSSGRAASMPLFKAVRVGKTTAVLTYTGGATPQTATFDVTVVAR